MNGRNELLRERAKILARVSETETSGATGAEFFEFALANERYAIEVRHIREVCPVKRLAPVPCTPPFVVGLMNLRGQIFSVIDIKKFFGLPDTQISESSKVVVVFDKHMELGIIADSIFGVRRFSLSEIRDDLSFQESQQEYLRGVTVERIGILDIPKLLGDDKLVVHEEVNS